MNSPAKTRAEARNLGLSKYFTGKPCSHGHVTERYVTGTCVECQRRAVREYGRRNPDDALQRSRKYQQNNRELLRARHRARWRQLNGLPSAPYPAPENCECCGTKLLGGIQTHLDHDHATGAFRGWLCNRCNRGFGYFGDTIAGVERALAYLKRTTG